VCAPGAKGEGGRGGGGRSQAHSRRRSRGSCSGSAQLSTHASAATASARTMNRAALDSLAATSSADLPCVAVLVWSVLLLRGAELPAAAAIAAAPDPLFRVEPPCRAAPGAATASTIMRSALTSGGQPQAPKSARAHVHSAAVIFLLLLLLLLLPPLRVPDDMLPTTAVPAMGPGAPTLATCRGTPPSPCPLPVSAVRPSGAGRGGGGGGGCNCDCDCFARCLRKNSSRCSLARRRRASRARSASVRPPSLVSAAPGLRHPRATSCARRQWDSTLRLIQLPASALLWKGPLHASGRGSGKA
jgi:hypothetical protein